jgi:hypothetical protein
VARPLGNPYHEAFCNYYVFGHPNGEGPHTWRDKPRRNATRSYETAYGVQGNTASSAAGRLLRRPEIRRRIDELEELRSRGDGDHR